MAARTDLEMSVVSFTESVDSGAGVYGLDAAAKDAIGILSHPIELCRGLFHLFIQIESFEDTVPNTRGTPLL